MAQPPQQTPGPRPLPADPHDTKQCSSMIFSILPSAVQSRLPRLPSFRRSVSMYRTARRKLPFSTSGSNGRDYSSAMVLRDLPERTSSDGEDVEGEGYFGGHASSTEDVSGVSTPINVETTGSTPKLRAMDLSENKSGIGWKFASQGLNLLSLSFDESTTISQDSRFGNANFARQLYIHSITYLLRALPSDLTSEEKLSVRTALPPGVVQPQPVPHQIMLLAPHKPVPTRSILHRTLASTIVYLFVILQFLLPYLKYLLATAYHYEREHKISEKLLTQSIDVVDVVGKQSLQFTAAIYGMGDGKVGQAIADAATWLVEGVTGGLHDGLGEAMVALGAKKGASESKDVAYF